MNQAKLKPASILTTRDLLLGKFMECRMIELKPIAGDII